MLPEAARTRDHATPTPSSWDLRFVQEEQRVVGGAGAYGIVLIKGQRGGGGKDI